MSAMDVDIIAPDDGDQPATVGAVQAENVSPPEEEDDSEYLNDDDLGKGPSGPPPLHYDIADGEDAAATSIPGIPTRHDFIVADETGCKLHNAVLATVRQNKPSLFLPNDIHEGVEWHRPEGAKYGDNNESTQRYVLTLFGILEDGSKAQVVLRDVPVYFDIWYPEGTSAESKAEAEAFQHKMSTALQELGLVNSSKGEAFPLRGYRRSPRQYLRVFFNNLRDRKRALQATRKMESRATGKPYETASDDMSSYFRMVARTYGIPLCSWVRVSQYRYKRGGAACNCKVTHDPRGNAPLPEAIHHPFALPVEPNTPLSEHVFDVSYANLAALVDPMNPDPALEKKVAEIDRLVRDRTLVTTFDIETHSPDKRTGKPPHQDKPHDVVFMLCMTAHWRSDPKPLARVCLTTQAAAPDKRWHTVICGPGGLPSDRVHDSHTMSPLGRPNSYYGQDSLLMAFALVWRAWAPDIHVGFNDMQYDWPFVVGKAFRLGLLGRMVELMSAAPRAKGENAEQIMRWQWRENACVKVSADKQHFISYLKLPGFIPIDLRAAYMRLYPKAEKTSLKWFLNKVKLGGKADMPYHHMWRIYEEAADLATRRREHAAGAPEAPTADEAARAAERMRHVAHYCIIDAARCQELLVQRNVVSDYREMGNYSYTALIDRVFYADGHKVRNMLGAYCQRARRLAADNNRYPLLMSMIAEEVHMEGKYPGAYVVSPEKGLEEDLPTTGLDFSSLYPSLIRTYNLSLDKAVFSEEEARQLEAEGEQIHRVEFEFGGETVRGWFVRHQEDDEKRGIFAHTLADLYNKRAGMKVGLKVCEAQIEFAEQAIGGFTSGGGHDAKPFGEFLTELTEGTRAKAAKAKAAGDKKKAKKLADHVADMEKFMEEARGDTKDGALPDSPVLLRMFEERLDNIEFRFKGIDSKQKAVKVFMNTFYGEAGNSKSTLFMLALAGGVTSAGRFNLKLVADFVTKQGFGIKYGDTDSLYLTCPPACYRADETKYWTALRDACVTYGLDVPEQVTDKLAELAAAMVDDAERPPCARPCRSGGCPRTKSTPSCSCTRPTSRRRATMPASRPPAPRRSGTRRRPSWTPCASRSTSTWSRSWPNTRRSSASATPACGPASRDATPPRPRWRPCSATALLPQSARNACSTPRCRRLTPCTP